MSRFTDCHLAPGVLERAQRGDMQAHETLYRVFRRPVYGLACRMVRSPEVADEVVQDTFVQVIRGIGAFKGDAPVGAWIRRIAVNQALMHLRSPWVQRGRPLPAEEAVGAQGRPVAACHAEQVRTRIDLEAALGSLSALTRAVVLLHDVEGYTHEEIGDLMGRTRSFSKSRLARAHRQLRELMQEGVEEAACMQPSNSY